MSANVTKEILDLIAEGDKGAVDLLWFRESANIHQQVMGYAEDKEVALTITAEVLAMITSKAGQFGARSKFFTWALSIVTNHVKNCGNRFSGIEEDAMSLAYTGEDESVSVIDSIDTVYSLQGNITDIYSTVEDEIVSDYEEEHGYGEED